MLFLLRTMPASTALNPACIMRTRIAQMSIQTVLQASNERSIDSSGTVRLVSGCPHWAVVRKNKASYLPILLQLFTSFL